MDFTASSNIASFKKMMTKEQKTQLPFATVYALTLTGKDGVEATRKQISKVFDRPTSFTKNAVGLLIATKTRMYSRVLIKDKQVEYLLTQETGGSRSPTRTAIVVPVGMRLNQHGNMPRGSIRRLLARSDTFSGQVRGIGGIWQRKKDGGVKLLVAYEPKAEYKPLFGFANTVRDMAKERFPVNFEKAFAFAMETAR